jgi:NADH-quinone oxidoreductase subunit A
MISEYFNLIIFLLLVFIISSLILVFNYFIVYQSDYLEKITAYECGFQPFEDSINSFDIRYYLVAILFLIFDLELMFLLP